MNVLEHLYLFTIFGTSVISTRFILYHSQLCADYHFKSCGINSQIVALHKMLTQYTEVEIAATPTA
jgi:hypothetical protein